MALAAGQRDVWEEVQNFAGRWRRCAGRLEAVSPPGGRGYGWSRGVSVESDGTGGIIRAGVGQTLCVTVVNVSLARRQDVAGVRAGGEGRRGGGGSGHGPGQRGRAVGAQGTS